MAGRGIDTLNLDIVNGNYELAIYRGEDINKKVSVSSSKHFEDVVLEVLNYQTNGILRYNAREANNPVLSGNIAEGNPTYEPDLLEWKLNIECPLSEPQQKILEEVVSMHNNFRHYLE